MESEVLAGLVFSESCERSCSRPLSGLVEGHLQVHMVSFGCFIWPRSRAASILISDFPVSRNFLKLQVPNQSPKGLVSGEHLPACRWPPPPRVKFKFFHTFKAQDLAFSYLYSKVLHCLSINLSLN